MNWVNNEFQEKQQGGLMAAMFGDSRFKGLDKILIMGLMKIFHHGQTIWET